VEWLGTARTSRRASVLSGIWRQEVTILLSQWEEGEKLCTNDEWAPQEFPFSDFTNMDSGFWLRKNSYKENKNPRKYGVVGNPIWNTFHYCNFFQISTIFELIKRFRVKADSTDLCSYRLIATNFANQPDLHFGQGLLHGDLQSLI
jgi:hypothetical protein